MWSFELFMPIACGRIPVLGKDHVSLLSMRMRHGDFDQELATASPSLGGHEREAGGTAGVYGARTRNLRRDRAAL